jgi:hypothetical protein
MMRGAEGFAVFPRFFGSAVASPDSLVYKAGSRSVAQPG